MNQRKQLAILFAAILVIAGIVGGLLADITVSADGAVTINGHQVLGGIAYVDELRATGSSGLALYDAAGDDGLRVLEGGNVTASGSISATSLHINPPTTSKAQLRFEASAAVDPSAPNSGDLWFNGTNLNFYNGSLTNDLLLSTRVETLVYTSGTPGAGEFTHALTQDPSIGNAVIEDITVVKTRISGGLARVQLFVEISYLQEDDTFNVTLAPGTLTSSFLPRVRAFRPTLNVVAYVLVTWVSADIVSVNRDNNIDGDSPAYFIIDGIGTW
ncbi:hypothetical protein LCGC14_2671530 [marine sediment metagenome]|uniref:Uncharacterized protein n=1 Tax=marine sediment metagenome TaxID=412755 RepID=A0A0F8ZNY9_9ZZZZ